MQAAQGGIGDLLHWHDLQDDKDRDHQAAKIEDEAEGRLVRLVIVKVLAKFGPDPATGCSEKKQGFLWDAPVAVLRAALVNSERDKGQP